MQRRVFISCVLLGWPLWIAFACTDELPLRVATFRCDVTPPLGTERQSVCRKTTREFRILVLEGPGFWAILRDVKAPAKTRLP